LSEPEIKAWLESLSKLVPTAISVSDNCVALNKSPDLTIHQLELSLDRMRDKKMGERLKKSLGTADK
jgi:hypothetical protein